MRFRPQLFEFEQIIVPAPITPFPQVNFTAIVAVPENSGPVAPQLGRSGDLTFGLFVSYVVDAGAPDAAVQGVDYQTLTGTVEFLPGEATASIIITPIPDGLVGRKKTITINLHDGSNAVSKLGQYTLGSQPSAVIQLLDTDVPPPPPPVVGITATQDVPEGQSATGFTITVGTGIGPLPAPLTIAYGFSGNSATYGSDFTASPESSITVTSLGDYPISITTLDDGLPDPKTVTLTITPDAAYTIGTSNFGGSATITDQQVANLVQPAESS